MPAVAGASPAGTRRHSRRLCPEAPALTGGTLVRHYLLKQKGENVTAKLGRLWQLSWHVDCEPPKSAPLAEETAPASSAFGHPQAADARMVNGPRHNLKNAVSPLPVHPGAGSRSYRGRSRSSVRRLVDPSTALELSPVLRSGIGAVKKDPG